MCTGGIWKIQFCGERKPKDDVHGVANLSSHEKAGYRFFRGAQAS
jgi:hypothetical protein